MGALSIVTVALSMAIITLIRGTSKLSDKIHRVNTKLEDLIAEMDKNKDSER